RQRHHLAAGRRQCHGQQQDRPVADRPEDRPEWHHRLRLQRLGHDRRLRRQPAGRPGRRAAGGERGPRRPGCDPEPLQLGHRQPAGQRRERGCLPQPHPGRRLCEGDGGTDPLADPDAGRYGDAGPGQVGPAERAEPAAVSLHGQDHAGPASPQGRRAFFVSALPAAARGLHEWPRTYGGPPMSRILLSNNTLAQYAGSELVTYEIAQHLVESGHVVTVATFASGGDIRQDFDALGVQWIDLSAPPAPVETHFDLYWGHHSSCFDSLLIGRNLSADRIVFSSLSPYEPLECPPLYADSL